MAFAILQEKEGIRHWVHICSATSDTITTAILGPPADIQYADRQAAERDAEIYRQQNARDVEATKRRRKYKEAPATYTVVPVTDEMLPDKKYQHQS